MRKIKRRHVAQIERFIEENGGQWADSSHGRWASVLRQFCRWQDERGLRSSHLTHEHLAEFLRCPWRRELSPLSRRGYRKMVRAYLRWLRGEGLLRQNHPLVVRESWARPTPAIAESFLSRGYCKWSDKTKENYKNSIRHFHQWLEQRQVAIEDVEESHLLLFGKHLIEYNYNILHRQKSDERLRVYLFWLHQQGVLKLRNPDDCASLQCLGTRVKVDLPAEALAFLEIAAVNRRSSTIDNYKSSCEHLHSFLVSRNTKLADLSRKDMEAWVKHLKSTGLSPSWRRSLIFRAKIYLFWLKQHDHIQNDPASLLLRTDTPKVPKLLPKPLKPEDDAALQRALAASGDIYCRALLLMRWTGIRIGELIDLEADCIWRDHAGHSYLKVPLGKLNNERMVPIDNKTVDLIEWLRSQRPKTDSEQPQRLIRSPTGGTVHKNNLRAVLHSICRENGIVGRINSHRLRHTYATSLLNGGMSLVGVMRLLGHRSIMMTLVYAAVSPESVRAEYLNAITKINERHQVRAAIQQIASEQDITEVSSSFVSLSQLIRRTAHHKKINPRTTRLIIKRIHRLQGEIEQLFQNPSPSP